MANDFTEDINVMALYEFESGSLHSDSIGGNGDFVDEGAPYSPAALGVGQDGLGAITCSVTPNGATYTTVTNSNLVSYPTSEAISVGFWMYLASGIASRSSRVSKEGAVGYDWNFLTYKDGRYDAFWASGVTSAGLGGPTPGTLAVDAWHHVFFSVTTLGVVVLQVRSVLGSLEVNRSTDIAAPLRRTAGPLRMFIRSDILIDELVIFNRVLTSEEAETITLGTFGAGAEPEPEPEPDPERVLPTWPAWRPSGYDGDFYWTPGTYTWGTDYIATGGGRWHEQFVAIGGGRVFYEAIT
jgi:hypothetical protein